jgi:hypothetical protein
VKKKVKLATQDWSYTCSDGCCYEYGQRLYVNGKELEHVDIHEDPHEAITKVLKQLGYVVEWEEMDDDSNDMRSE